MQQAPPLGVATARQAGASKQLALQDQEQMPHSVPTVEVTAEAVRVAVRVRPLSMKEQLEGSQMCIRYPDGNAHRMVQIGQKESGKSFTFDSVFHADDPQVRKGRRTLEAHRLLPISAGAVAASHFSESVCFVQASVYAEVACLVDKVVSGFNATVLAYGQTGSGKTHTMGSAAISAGDDSDDALLGIIPR